MTIACKVLPHRRQRLELDITVLRGITLRAGHLPSAIPTIDMIGAFLILRIEVPHTQRKVEGLELPLVLHHLGEMIPTRRLGKNTPYLASSEIDDWLV